MNCKVLGVSLFILISSCDSARILGVIPTPAYSHQQVFHPIWKELSLRGHQVTTITTDPLKDPKLINLTEVDLHSVYEMWNKHLQTVTTSGALKSITIMVDNMMEVYEYILNHSEVQSIINNDTEHFDLVIIEYITSPFYAFSERFKAPVVVITCFDAVIDLHHIMGNFIHPMLYPHHILPVHYDLTFFDRIVVVMFNVFSEVMTHIYVPVVDTLIRKHFDDSYMSVSVLKKNISLILSNSDPIFHKVKPLPPTIVEFGAGTHRILPKPLPEDIQKTLDKAKNGFIYFSLGSNVQTNFLPEATLKNIIETFSEIPYTVIWKCNDDIPNKPSNVVTLKWLPQQDIFKHPNIKLFITQGGLMSMDEAIYDHIPMLAIPFFSDQQYNAYRMVEKGFGLTLSYKTLTKKDFKSAVLELINNPKYKTKLIELAELAQDQPMNGLEKAIWWIEYVIRYNGTEHLRSPYLDMPIYQYYYLDIFVIFAVVIVTLLSFSVFLTKMLIKLIKKISNIVKLKSE